jgi:SAM-dependent methyltransferase
MEKLVAYINAELCPRLVTSDEALYEHMASQSNYSLSIVYKPFDATKRWHWADHGRCLDYLEVCGGGDLLDIGPGDGWPSLPVAFHARSVTGIDASPRRIAVCEENARRLGLSNFRGAVYTAGAPLPFPHGHFDGAMAASSIENSPDPRALLREIRRVLRPGGKLRIGYEEPSRYDGQPPQELHLWPLEGDRTYLYLIDRHLTEERVDHYCLILNGRVERVEEPGDLGPRVVDAMTYSLSLPGCRTWLKWLHEAGFTSAHATHDGGRYAAGLFDQIDPSDRPTELAGVERLLRPGVRVVSELEAPPERDPMITAIK